jgi:hypothetical protein
MSLLLCVRFLLLEIISPLSDFNLRLFFLLSSISLIKCRLSKLFRAHLFLSRFAVGAEVVESVTGLRALTVDLRCDLYSVSLLSSRKDKVSDVSPPNNCRRITITIGRH